VAVPVAGDMGASELGHSIDGIMDGSAGGSTLAEVDGSAGEVDGNGGAKFSSDFDFAGEGGKLSFEFSQLLSSSFNFLN